MQLGDLTPATMGEALSTGLQSIAQSLSSGMTNMATVMRKRLVLTGSTLRPRSDEFKALLADEIYNHAWPLFEEGAIAPVMDRGFPLAEAGTAHAHMEAGDHIGKIVLEVGGE